ncbi:TonB-dependent receptor [Porphyromonas sp.]|uniref:TonB-dependent receptor n=1 Tax=Porphyromonas sp. TaxID=1924944 RepID=UPI0026DA887D|nr:TonB-dependent receptor [Porphyromonas sp.]MDO4771175.1 TonB-dependent receptor [Porphyromonas sp.]
MKFGLRNLVVVAIITLLANNLSYAQKHHILSGTVYEVVKGKQTPLPYALVSLPDYKMGANTLIGGKYLMKGIPSGRTRVQVTFIGKQPIDTTLVIDKDRVIDFVLKEDNFRLKEVSVTAKKSDTRQATASKISRNAIEHLQALSLRDVLALLPGGTVKNPTLSNASQVNIRTATGSYMNALGTSIIQDGAPLSNNANLQSMNPAVVGSIAPLSGGASPGGGIDTRMISIDDVESVEVVRGIPSVEYGDLTSGAVVIRSKAGRQPISINAKVNPNVYQASAHGGVNLGGHLGAISVGGDYAFNVTNPIQTYNHYQRTTGKVLYSNTFFDDRLSSNTSINLIYGKDSRDLNPDDIAYKRKSSGKRTGVRLNTHGAWRFNEGILKNINYVLSYAQTHKRSEHEEMYHSANAPYSATLVDGSVLSNIAGEHLFDAEGKEITQIPSSETNPRAHYLPSSYLGRQTIDGREINIYGKLSADFHKRWGDVNNRILVGADFRIDGNKGKGKQFDQEAVPYRNLSALNATFRPRNYNEIPFMKQFGLYAEENFHWQTGKGAFKAQAGLRYDHADIVGGVLSPRINAEYNFGNGLSIHAGYGNAAKMPTLFYLYPEKAYFEYINLNELADTKISEADRRFITTTRIFDTQNRDLKIAENKKYELGVEYTHKAFSASATLFREELNNGYTMNQTLDSFHPVMFKEYKRNAEGKLILAQENPVLASYYKPFNGGEEFSQGLEYELNVHRIEAIRTAFTLTGSYIHTVDNGNMYFFYDNSGPSAKDRTHVGVYDPDMSVGLTTLHNTALRITHNIPEIGLVITLTSEITWKDVDRNIMGNDSIPIMYISKEDGKVRPFEDNMKEDPEFKKLIRNVNPTDYITESYPPLVGFNLNVTKEISDFMRISFFANNVFRSYPLAESKRSPGFKTVRNNNFFFGLELSFKL